MLGHKKGNFFHLQSPTYSIYLYYKAENMYKTDNKLADIFLLT